MTSADRKTCIESLDRLKGLYRRFNERLSGGEEAVDEPFPQFTAALGTTEERVRREKSRVVVPGALAVWEAVVAGRCPASQMSPLTVDRLCAIPQVAMSQLFLTLIQSEKRPVSEWGLVGLVRSYHQEWADLINRFSVVEVIRSRLADDTEPKSPRVRVWKAHLRCLVDANDVDNLSLEAVNGRLSPGHLVHRFGIDNETAFMSAVVATGIRRICQKHRPSAEDIDFLADGLLSFHGLRSRDLGRALANVIAMNHGRPPSKVRGAIERLTRAHPVLGPLPEQRSRWIELVGETAVATVEKWSEPR